jgi:hypothetical protein
MHNRLKAGTTHAMAFKGMRDKIDKIQDELGKLFLVEDVPIPFTYCEFVCFIVA